MASRDRRNRATVGALLTIVAAMIGLTAASVPLYRLFCQVTGYGGTTQRASAAPKTQVADRLITVRFNAEEAPDLGWEFRPLQASVTVPATYNVTPAKAGPYFDKLQCFCFTKQHLAPGQSADLSVSFFVDPDIASDPETRDVDTITLSYTMFRAKTEEPVRSSALPG